jgi:hypothetical protein
MGARFGKKLIFKWFRVSSGRSKSDKPAKYQIFPERKEEKSAF